jgi:hypothetical protein
MGLGRWGEEATVVAEWHAFTWEEAMQRGYTALAASEAIYEDIDAAEGRSNVDIEKHLRRAEVKAAQAQAWFLMAAEVGVRREAATAARSA